MATRAEAERRIDLTLEALERCAADLPQVAAEWNELPDGERASWGLDWAHLMADYLPELAEYVRSGQLSLDRQERYRDLKRKLKEALPLIGKLKLARPPILLEV